jgi:hypothetical protein
LSAHSLSDVAAACQNATAAASSGWWPLCRFEAPRQSAAGAAWNLKSPREFQLQVSLESCYEVA